jgi:hypothetical protein
MTKTQIIYNIACDIAAGTESFHRSKGAAQGILNVNFLKTLCDRVCEELSLEFSEKQKCSEHSSPGYFFIEEEKCIVIIALGLTNAVSEFEKDIYHALIAKEQGLNINKLVFISRPGAAERCIQPGRQEIRKWAMNKHDLTVEVWDLPAEEHKI